jgi:toxin ParE1/3/4
MRRRRIEYTPRARRDLIAIGQWVHDVASRDTARSCMHRVRQRIESLRDSAERGSVRDGPVDNLRVIGLMRSISVAFVTTEDVVRILRVMYGGQDWQSDLSEQSDTEE